MGCHVLLQGIFPAQGSNPRLLWLLHRQVDCLALSLLGSPGEGGHGLKWPQHWWKEGGTRSEQPQNDAIQRDEKRSAGGVKSGPRE